MEQTLNLAQQIKRPTSIGKTSAYTQRNHLAQMIDQITPPFVKCRCTAGILALKECEHKYFYLGIDHSEGI